MKRCRLLLTRPFYFFTGFSDLKISGQDLIDYK
jgi:hypothetical protein